MAMSMTGFGRGEAASEQYKFSAEIRTVNHRYFDVSVRMPRTLSHLEDKVRKAVMSRIKRGKTEVFITCGEVGERSRKVDVDIGLARAFADAARRLGDNVGLLNDVSVSSLLRIPELIKISDADVSDDEIWATLLTALSGALNVLTDMRTREGGLLSQDILDKLQKIESRLFSIEERAPQVTVEYRERLLSRLEELLGQNMPDENRIAAEIVLFADKCCIDEEIVRLKSHIAQMRSNIWHDADTRAQEEHAQGRAQEEPVGRKLDFIVQEINREVNTIGSKANDVLIGKIVVEMKAEIEKIREQVQNIE